MTRTSREAPALDPRDRSDWFVGDLTDPWIAAIADALPESVIRHGVAGDLPEELLPIPGSSVPGTLVLHRTVLTARDAAWLARLRNDRAAPTRVILCVGPHVRYADLERWSPLVEVVLPEATARDTVARHLHKPDDDRPRPVGPRPGVAIVSTNFELRSTLADACEQAGYPATAAFAWAEASPGGLAVWDVPVLESGWPEALARRARLGPVIALLGFADRGLVTAARVHGASACLELPCDLADLIGVLDRLSSTVRSEAAHDVPPPPVTLRRSPRAVAVQEQEG
jgi:hypothetical protein